MIATRGAQVQYPPAAPAAPRKPTTTLHLTVPQGVGDVYWVWQKVRPLCDRIHFSIIEPAGQPRSVSRRAEAIITGLPGVARVDYVPYTFTPEGSAWLTRRIPLRAVLEKAAEPEGAAWAVNAWLEAGTPLEDVDPDLPVAWEPSFPERKVPGFASGHFLAVYVSGDAARHKTLCEKVWSPEEWARFVDRVCYHHSVGTSVPILVIGAAFDYPVLSQVAESLERSRFKTSILCDLYLSELTWIFRNAWGFLGYQSGLNVLCDAAGGRQHMLYFPRLKAMRDSWVRPAHRGTGIFRHGYFDQAPEAAALDVHFPAPGKITTSVLDADRVVS